MTMKHRFTVLLFALLSLGHLAAQVPDPTNSRGGGIDTPDERTAFKTALELQNVDNTSDAGKPVSSATQTALDGKATSTLSNVTPSVGRLALGASDNGADLFTSKAPKLRRLWTRVLSGYTTPTHINVLATGDSLMARCQGNPGGFTTLQQMFGVAGTGCGGLGSHHGGPVVSGGASIPVLPSLDHSRWWPGNACVVPAAGEAIYNWNTNTPIFANQVKIYYVSESGGGTFKLQSRLTNMTTPGAWTDIGGFTSVSTDNGGAISAGVATVSLTAGRYEIKVVGLSGTVRIIGAVFRDTTAAGVVLCSIAAGGTDYEHWDDTPAAVVNAVIGDISPTLVVHCNTGTTTQGNLDAMFGRLATASNAHDRIVLGVFPNQAATHVTQNPILEQWCRDNRAEWLNPEWFWSDWNALNADGWADDETHPNTTAAAFFLTWGWDRLLAGFPASQPLLPSGNGGGSSNAVLVDGRIEATGIHTNAIFSCRRFAVGGYADSGLRFWDQVLGVVGNNNHSFLRSNGELLIQDPFSNGISIQNASGQLQLRPTTAQGANARLGTLAQPWGRAFVGGLSLGIVSKTTTFTATEFEHTILCDATAGAFDIDLPAAASHTGRVYTIKKTDASANAVSIDPNGSELIDGSSTSLALPTQWSKAMIQSNGTAWFRID
jgi:hypothetical protein